MIDITKIQMFDVLPDLRALNNTNISLGNEKKVLTTLVNVLLIGTGLYIGYRLLSYYNRNRVRTSREELIVKVDTVE